MNFRRRHKGHTAVEAGALSDILFFLMLFFLIISTLASPSAIKLLLPKAATGQTVPKQIINLSVNAAKEIYVENQIVSIERLTQVLEDKKKGLENANVVLRMDKDLSVEFLISVVDEINKAKVPLVIATDKKR